MKRYILLLLTCSVLIFFNAAAAIIPTETTNAFQPKQANYSFSSETVATLTIADKTEAINGNLATVATEGFYKVSFQVTVNRQPLDLGLLTIRFTYTDAEGEEMSAPATDIENINLLLSDTTNKGGLNSSFLLHIAAGSVVSYAVTYASSPSPEEDADNAMQYSVHMVLEKL